MPKVSGAIRECHELANLMWPWANLIRWQVLFRHLGQYRHHLALYHDLLRNWKQDGCPDFERLASVEWLNAEQYSASTLTLLDQLHVIEAKLTELAPELLGKFPRFTTDQNPTAKDIRTFAAAMGGIRGKLIAKNAKGQRRRPKAGAEGLGRKEAAAFLGISERKLWSLTAGGEIPVARVGMRVLYPLSALQTWLAQQTKGGQG